MEKLGERNYELLKEGFRTMGMSVDVFSYIEERLYADETEEIGKFVLWLVEENLPFGSGTYEEMFQFWKNNISREEIKKWFQEEHNYDIDDKIVSNKEITVMKKIKANNEMVQYCKEKIKDNPSLKEEIIELYELAVDEVEGGSSLEDEFELLKRDVEELCSSCKDNVKGKSNIKADDIKETMESLEEEISELEQAKKDPSYLARGITVEEIDEEITELENKLFDLEANIESNIEALKDYIFHSDPGHGWLEVGKDELEDLGIADKISSYSYIKGDRVYLEEDADAIIFIEMYKEQYGQEPVFIDSYKEKSPIRDYSRYEHPDYKED